MLTDGALFSYMIAPGSGLSGIQSVAWFVRSFQSSGREAQDLFHVFIVLPGRLFDDSVLSDIVLLLVILSTTNITY